jgi:uncharacterized damage-inducible protein DinB
MKQSQILLGEFQQEAANTRKLLALVPMDNLEYKPHEKSMSLGRLSFHVAEITGWWKVFLINNELDFAKGNFTPKVFETNTALLAYYDDLVSKAETILKEVADEEFSKPWTMRNGKQIYFTMHKAAVVRTWCLNHWYHHRAQLGVYLRLLNIPVPGVYGPSADDNGM